MIKRNTIVESGLSAGITLEGIFNYSKYLIPVYGPLFLFGDVVNMVAGDPMGTTASRGYYDYTKAYLLANQRGFTTDQIYNISAAIGRYYTDIQRRRELTPDESSQMDELSELADQLTAMTTPESRVTPPAYDAGKNIPAPVKISEYNPFAGITDTLAKFKWVFIGAGLLLTLNVAAPIITTAMQRWKK